MSIEVNGKKVVIRECGGFFKEFELADEELARRAAESLPRVCEIFDYEKYLVLCQRYGKLIDAAVLDSIPMYNTGDFGRSEYLDVLFEYCDGDWDKIMPGLNRCERILLFVDECSLFDYIVDTHGLVSFRCTHREPKGPVVSEYVIMLTEKQVTDLVGV